MLATTKKYSKKDFNLKSLKIISGLSDNVTLIVYLKFWQPRSGQLR